MRQANFEQDDKALVEQVAAGDRAAMNHFFNKFEKIIYASIRRNSRAQEQDIADLYNSFFIRLTENGCKRLMAWTGQARLSTYLATLAYNHVRDYYRLAGVRVSGNDELDPNWPAQTVDPVDLIDGGRLKAELKRAKRTLSEKDRSILCCRMFREEDAATCAERLNMKPNAFYQAYNRATTRLIEAFKKHNPLLFPETEV